MRLKDRNGPIPTGLWYQYSDDKGNTYRVNGMDLTFGSQFIQKVKSDMKNKNVEVPENLDYLIEQQICGRIPGQYCWQEAGDKVASVIHKFANLGDRVASTFGVNAQLETRAKNCPSCQKRREAMNKTIG
jgi:hypothetical protein